MTTPASPHARDPSGSASDPGEQTVFPAPAAAQALLQTKLFTPALQSTLVARPHLLAQLDESGPAGVTLLSAPAGFGKTTLVAHWAQGRASVAWLALDEADNDPVRFWRHAAAALATARPEVTAERQPQPAETGQDLVEPLVASLINEIVSLPETSTPLTLVLDDYHLISANEVHRSLHFLLTHQPPRLRIVLLTRADPPLALARLRVQGRLVELRAADLRFGQEEVETFLRRSWRLPLTDEQVALLAARTEGWPAGLQLAALVLPRGSAREIQRAVADFAGDNRLVMEYLVDEVLARQPEPVQQFLLCTAVLDRLNPGLCAALLEQDQAEAARTLDLLRERNLFLTPLDEAGEWYRYHPLLAEALRSRLSRDSSQATPTTLHRRAAQWFAGAGFMYRAIRHALAAPDYELAAVLIGDFYRVAGIQGELITLRGWLEALPPEIRKRDVRLCLAAAWAYAYVSSHDAFAALLADAEAALAQRREAEVDRLRAEIAALAAVHASLYDQPLRTLELARKARAIVPRDDALLLALACQAEGNAQRLLGKLAEARAAYRQAQQQFSSLAMPLLSVVPLARLGQVQAMQGELTAAADTFARVLKLAGDGGGAAMIAGETWIHLAELHREWNQLEKARAYAHREIDLVEPTGNVTARLSGYLSLARIEMSRGDVDATVAALDRAEDLAAIHNLSAAQIAVAAHRARLWLSIGAVDEAARVAAIYEIAAGLDQPLPAVWLDFVRLTLARIHLAQQRPAQAEALLEAVVAKAQADGRQPVVLEATLLQALAAQARGVTARAQALIAETAYLAAPEGYVRLFVDEGAAASDLLQAVARLPGAAARGPDQAYLSHLLAAFPTPQVPADAELVEPLTEREVEVLQLMATGATNRQIADKLVISVGTVKGHINHILSKLQAQNRTSAVAIARDLNLLDEEP